MKKNILLAVAILLCFSVSAQNPIDYSSYSRIVNSDFKKFVTLFRPHDFPISADWLLANVKLRGLVETTALGSTQINKYLMDEGELVTGPLYTEIPDEGAEEVPVIGNFYPLFKLPTNGNYVLLVFAQIAPFRDCNDMVFVLSYDLNGKFIYFSNYTYQGGTENINNSIDSQLRSHVTYVVNKVGGELVFPSLSETFNAEEAHMIYQINQDGKSTRASFEKTSGQFRYNEAECRFKRIN